MKLTLNSLIKLYLCFSDFQVSSMSSSSPFLAQIATSQISAGMVGPNRNTSVAGMSHISWQRILKVWLHGETGWSYLLWDKTQCLNYCPNGIRLQFRTAPTVPNSHRFT